MPKVGFNFSFDFFTPNKKWNRMKIEWNRMKILHGNL